MSKVNNIKRTFDDFVRILMLAALAIGIAKAVVDAMLEACKVFKCSSAD